jgi:DNA-binding transcriptional LysR family regulator
MPWTLNTYDNAHRGRVAYFIAREIFGLGVRLFVRTTRRVHLTDEGRLYFERCREALSLMRDAEGQLSGHQLAPSGLLRISVASPYGHYRVLPLLPRFRAIHPLVQFEIHLSNRNVDFTAEDFDLAIRGRAPPDSSLVARKLEDAELVLVAAPAYLARAGTPSSLDELVQHECLQFVLPSTGQSVPWLFRVDGQDLELRTAPTYRCADDYLGVVTLVRQGAGLLQTYRYIVQEDIVAGRLREILPENGGRSRPFSLIYPNRLHVPLRVRALIEFLVGERSKAPTVPEAFDP